MRENSCLKIGYSIDLLFCAFENIYCEGVLKCLAGKDILDVDQIFI